ncbi:kinase-like domain-containing protein [Cytidiella melzeri]|nr:kinase-like domain-containing protein [Cytidiella melzeri]
MKFRALRRLFSRKQATASPAVIADAPSRVPSLQDIPSYVQYAPRTQGVRGSLEPPSKVVVTAPSQCPTSVCQQDLGRTFKHAAIQATDSAVKDLPVIIEARDAVGCGPAASVETISFPAQTTAPAASGTRRASDSARSEAVADDSYLLCPAPHESTARVNSLKSTTQDLHYSPPVPFTTTSGPTLLDNAEQIPVRADEPTSNVVHSHTPMAFKARCPTCIHQYEEIIPPSLSRIVDDSPMNSRSAPSPTRPPFTAHFSPVQLVHGHANQTVTLDPCALSQNAKFYANCTCEHYELSYEKEVPRPAQKTAFATRWPDASPSPDRSITWPSLSYSEPSPVLGVEQDGCLEVFHSRLPEETKMRIKNGEDVYEVLGLIHTGEQSMVVMALGPASDCVVAIKCIYKSIAYATDDGKSMLLQEKRMMQSLTEEDVPGVVRLRASWSDYSTVYLVMDYCSVNLATYMPECIPQHLTFSMHAAQLVQNLARLHAAGVYHGNICPRNILVDRHGDLFFADFGRSVRTPMPRFTVSYIAGASGYQAPELIDEQYLRSENQVADVWSLGIVLLEMYWQKKNEGVFWKQEESEEKIKQAIRAVHPRDLPEMRALKRADLGLYDLLCQMLADANARASAAELLNHPYVTEGLRKLKARRNDYFILGTYTPMPATLVKMYSSVDYDGNPWIDLRSHKAIVEEVKNGHDLYAFQPGDGLGEGK